MSTKTDSFIETLDALRTTIHVNSVWLHKKGGTYVVVGHAVCSDTLEGRINYRRIAGPNFDRVKDSLIEWSRPASQWTRDRFIPRPERWMKDENWKCRVCGAFKGQGCGGQNRLIQVPYEDGVRLERPACPMDFVGDKKSWLTSFLNALKDVFRLRPG